MNVRAISLTVVAFLLGALAAGGIGVRVIREVNTAEGATSLPTPAVTSTTTPATASSFYVDRHETIVSSAALIPTLAEVGNSGLAISYDLVSMAPQQDVEPLSFVGGFGVITTIENDDLDHIYPRAWVVETESGSWEGGPANSRIRVARFDVDDGFSIADIIRVEIVEALISTAIEVPFTLSADDPIVEVYPGVTMELLNISDQGSSTIVQVGINEEGNDDASFFVQGDGPGWRSAVFEAEGRPRVNLTWVGGDLPEAIPLFATGHVWVEVEGPFEVSLEGVR